MSNEKTNAVIAGGPVHARPIGATPARMAALRAVKLCRIRKSFAEDVIESTIDNSTIASSDRAFASKLVLGVVSTRGVLEEVLDRCLDSPDDVKPDVRDALCISTYEIIFLDKEPYAAVSQGVELVRGIAPQASGLANAVLRRVVEARDEFPFGDPTQDLAAHARVCGFPLWIAELLAQDLGTEQAHAFMDASNEPAPVFVAVNAIKSNDDDIVQLLEDAGGDPEPVQVDGRVVEGCYRIDSARMLLEEKVDDAFSDGLLFVSDAAAQRVAQLVLPCGEGEEPDGPPASFLEIGAGRGTKTILLQSFMRRRWGSSPKEYVVVDKYEFRIRALINRINDYGLSISELLVADGTELDKDVDPDRLFDIIFIDAPCSGLGTLRRHPDILWRLTPEMIDESAQCGLDMLKNAASHVAPGGILAYATCTVTTAENESVISKFLESEQGSAFEIVPIGEKDVFASDLTSQGCDAHFMAKMRRKADDVPYSDAAADGDAPSSDAAADDARDGGAGSR